MNLRQHIRDLQILENAAADKAGMRFQLLDERTLLGNTSDKYIRKYIGQLERDIASEAVTAAKMGKELNREITK